MQETNTDSTRALASIQLVDSVKKHTGADTLELTTILGWQVVTKIGEAREGAKIVYFEVDSLLPADAPWLLKSIKEAIDSRKLTSHYRVKTIKIRGELSQGLITPLENFPSDFSSMEIGTNLTSLLNIKQYEAKCERQATSPKVKVKEGSFIPFPTFLLRKTEEVRIQSYPKLLKELTGRPYYATLKLDGASASYLINPQTQEFMICSHNRVCRKDDFNTIAKPYWLIALKYKIEEKLRINPNLAIQGEICGPKIQKNLLGLTEYDFFIFNIIDLRTSSRLEFPTMISLCQDVLALKHVPIEEASDDFRYESIKSLLIKAEGLYSETKNQREGLVFRSKDQAISFKVINNEYLLKHQ